MDNDYSDFNPSHETIIEAAKYCSGFHQYCKEVYTDGRKRECPFADASNAGLECQQLFAEELIAYRALGTVEHMTELVKAESEWRLVVSCKIGRTVYIVDGGKINRCVTENALVRNGLMARELGTDTHYGVYPEDMGKTVFLTRAEAEASLEEEEPK